MANRIARILKSSTAEQGCFVDGEINPADLCSRGIKADEKEKWDIYHNGPMFLRKPRSEWPTMKVPVFVEEDAVAAVRIVEDKLSPEEEKELWVWETASRVSGWQSKVWLMVRLKKIARIFKVKASKRASRARSEELANIERQSQTVPRM